MPARETDPEVLDNGSKVQVVSDLSQNYGAVSGADLQSEKGNQEVPKNFPSANEFRIDFGDNLKNNVNPLDKAAQGAVEAGTTGDAGAATGAEDKKDAGQKREPLYQETGNLGPAAWVTKVLENVNADLNGANKSKTLEQQLLDKGFKKRHFEDTKPGEVLIVPPLHKQN